MLKKFVTLIGGDPTKRAIERMTDVVDQVNALEEAFDEKNLSDAALRAKTDEFRARLQAGETLDDLLPEAFAAVREASKRVNGQRHYDVQIIGGAILHQGKIAEMRTGEGKTLVATLPVYLNALTGRGVHLITVNDYLARRDARWMGRIYNALGLSVGVLQMAARTENGKKAFLVDFERESPNEDQNQLRMVPRAEAYAADVVYGTNSEFGFDYLRDNMTMHLEDRVQRGHYFAIVDEVDNILIDEARTPLIISGPANEDTEWYARMAQAVRALRDEDYEVSERDRNVTLTEIGEVHVEELLGVALRDPDRPEDVTPEQARLMGYLEQALRAQHLFKRNKDYLVQGGKVLIIDEFTGRLMPGRRWSDGLHQAVEAKEGLRVQSENVTYATITIQNYFRMYAKLAGMSGTAVTEAEEFDKIYKLEVLTIPTNLEYRVSRPEAGMALVEDRDEQGYKFRYYAYQKDPEKKPVYFQRKDHPDIIYRTEEIKFRSIATEILQHQVLGRPVLVGTTSVELSDRLSARLRAEPLRRLAQVMLLRNAWMEKNNRFEDGRLVEELVPLNQPLDGLQVGDLRKMARELDISVNAEDPENLTRLLKLLELPESGAGRLKACLQGGIPHKVLNAREHDREGRIIAGAGAHGAVTIATNMAGRGVDIKLGGELDEDVVAYIKHHLKNNGIENPYGMPNAEILETLLSTFLKREELPPVGEAHTAERFRQIRTDLLERYAQPGGQDEWGQLSNVLYNQFGVGLKAAENFLPFWKHTEDELSVRSLGGLAVIGSERHEARRIDNQLRGRSSRQGDPGSSRFYLSLQDELMVRFGGDQAENLMKRMRFDDSVPMEVGLVSRLVEGSQTRVEGANFDIRKHLLEYDDVLNQQRKLIYAQRERVMTKEDLSEDVTEMLRTEVMQRVPLALDDEGGPWKLLSWLDQVQPPFNFASGNGPVVFPSYTLRLLLDHLESQGISSPAQAQQALLQVAERSLQTEDEHLLRMVESLVESTRSRLEATLNERLELLDTYFEGLKLDEDAEDGPRTPRQVQEELSTEMHLQIRLSAEEQRLLREAPRQVQKSVRSQVESELVSQSAMRLVTAVERRLEESIDLNPAQAPELDWKTLPDLVIHAVQAALEKRRERLLGNGSGPAGGQIGKDIETTLARFANGLDRNRLLAMLLIMPQGTRSGFDKKTHRRVVQRTNRLTYTYYAATLIEESDPQRVAEEVLAHLEQAQKAIHFTWGASEFSRLSRYRLNDLDEQTQAQLGRVLGEETCRSLQNQPLQSLDKDAVGKVVTELGRKALTLTYRTLLLGVTSELWVEYLTQMEALRVAIGLEAYAQRDPLVEYKKKASQLFQDLFSSMRLGVVTRMFTYRPRELSVVQTDTRRGAAERELEAEAVAEQALIEEEQANLPEEEADEEETSSQPGGAAQDGMSKSQKRRRRRH